MKPTHALMLAGLFSAAMPLAAATCSALESGGQIVNLNEVRYSGNNPVSGLPDEFIELLFLANFTATSSGVNRLQVCRAANKSPQCVTLAAGSYTAGQFVVVTGLNVGPSGDEIVILDGNGGVLDRLIYDNGGRCNDEEWPISSGTCSSGCLTNDANSKDIERLPDGTGGWSNTDSGNTAGGPNVVASLHHLRVLHDGAGLTCNPETVTVQACADASCTSLFTGSVSGNLTVNGSAVGSIAFSGGSTTADFRWTTPGTVTLGASVGSPTGAGTTRCFIGATETCAITFADSGFVFDVPNHISATSQTVTVSAVRKDDSAQQCVPGFANVTRSVGFWSSYVNPATGTQSVAVNGTAIGTASPGSARALSFNASGQATLTLAYPDAGQVRLNARYAGSAGTGDSGLVMTGQDDFIAKPKDFLLAVTGTGPGGATSASGAVFARAGVPFSATVTARNANDVATPNFGREAVPERVRIDTSLQAPTGGNNPALVAASGFGAFSNGVATGQWRWDEVGILTLTPRLADGDYLGYGTPAQPAPGNSPDIVGAALPNVGRFVPARLAVTPNVPVLAPACVAGGFGYTGQEFGFATAPQFTVSGVSGQGGITGNYVNASGAANAFWKFPGSLANRSYVNEVAGIAATLSRTTAGGDGVLSGHTAAPFDGTGTVTVSGDRLTYARPAAPEGPFDARVSLTLTAADLTDGDGVCFDSAALDGCDALTVTGLTGTAQRWGRLALTNAYGPEVFDLRIPMRAEYFNGATFVVNAADVCSAVTIGPLVDANAGDTLQTGDTCVQDTGSPGASGQGCSAAAPADRRFTATAPVSPGGEFVFWLRAPGVGKAGILDVSAVVPAWLRFNWRGTGELAPTARVGFGVYQGDQRAIHEREVY